MTGREMLCVGTSAYSRRIVMDNVCSDVVDRRKSRRDRQSLANSIGTSNMKKNEVRLGRGHLGMILVVETD